MSITYTNIVGRMRAKAGVSKLTPQTPQPSYGSASNYSSSNVYGYWEETSAIQIKSTRLLSDDDLDRIGPTPLYHKMIRNRLSVEASSSGPYSTGPSEDKRKEICQFIEDSTTGLYYISPSYHLVMFELAEDMTMFKLRFEGTRAGSNT